MSKGRKNINLKNIAKRDSNKYYPYVLISLLAFLVYANSIPNDYALDDAIVITGNSYTTEGIDGIGKILTTDTFQGFFNEKKNLVAGGRYRPVSLITFAIEYEFFGENPGISHFINVLLYVFTALVMYKLLTMLFSRRNNSWFLSIPLIATVFFVLHPVHTEVVANIKGRDEIIALLGGLLSLLYILKYQESKKVHQLILSLLFLFIGIMSKENAVAFVFITPLAFFFFKDIKLGQNLAISSFLLIPAIVFMVVRQSVLGAHAGAMGVMDYLNCNYNGIPGELMNNPFLEATCPEKYATIFYTFSRYLGLLFFPVHLTYDYYPYHIPIKTWGDPGVYAGLMAIIIIAGIAIMLFRKKSPVSFGILFFILSFGLMSNLLFPIGVFMGERFLYMPSVGFCLVLAYLINHLLEKPLFKQYATRYSIIGFTILAFGLLGTRTIARNPVWKNDYTLFTTDVKTSVHSAKGNCSAGGKILEEVQKIRDLKWDSLSLTLFERRLKEQSLLPKKELDNLFENSQKNALHVAMVKKEKSMLEQSMDYLHHALEIHPEYVDALLLLGNAKYEYYQSADSMWHYYKPLLKLRPGYELAYSNLEQVIKTGENVEAEIKLLEEINQFNPKRYRIHYKLGVLHGKYKGNLRKSAKHLEKALQINPRGVDAMKDLGVVHGMSGNHEMAIEMFENAIKINKNDLETYKNLILAALQANKIEKVIDYYKELKKVMPEKTGEIDRMISGYCIQAGKNELLNKIQQEISNL